MFENLLNTAVTDDSELDSAFGDGKDSKDKTIKKAKDDKTKDKGQPSSKDKTVLGPKTATISELSEDEDIAFATEEELEEQEAEKKKKAEKKKEVKKVEEDEDEEETDEDEDSEDEEEEEEEEEEKKDTKKKDKKEVKDEKEEDEEETDETDEEKFVKTFLQQRAELLIKKGVWTDFEGRDEYPWDEESFEEMEIKQAQYRESVLKDEILEKFGPYGREIAEYVEKGGDPDDLLDIFKEQQRVETIDVSTEDGQKAAILKYETEFLNKKTERVKKYIDNLIADNELEEVAKEAKEEMDKVLSQQAKDLKVHQENLVKAAAAKQEAEIKRFSNDVTALVNKADDIPADEKKQILKALTQYDKKLKNGTPVNEFYFKFADFKKNLPDYVDLVRFVLNKNKFIKTIKNEQKTEQTEKAFKLIRTANKNKSAKSVDTNNNKDTKPGSKFQLL